MSEIKFGPYEPPPIDINHLARLVRKDISGPLRICRGCGCDDLHACPGGCTWVLLDFACVDGYALETAGNALATVPAIRIVPLPSGICSQCAEAWEWDMAMMANALSDQLR